MSTEHTIVIAEAGVNYNGDIDIAKRMVRAAAESGADYVKFQTGLPRRVISRFARKAEYQAVNTKNSEESQLEMAEKLMLPWDVYDELIECCKDNRIKFLSTPFDIESASFLHSLGMSLWKIPSGEITNLPLLEHIAGYKEPVIMSTGMSTVEEIRAALDVLRNAGVDDITLLQCNTEYPTPYGDANLRAMNTLRAEFGTKAGYSDHTMGIEVTIAAVAMGACLVEKHFTLDRKMPGPDQVASIEPDELKNMVSAIRNIELAMGSGVKAPSSSEKKNMAIARKSIVADRAIKKGEVFSKDNLTCKRPGDGISPMKWHEVIGMTADRDYEEDEPIVIKGL